LCSAIRFKNIDTALVLGEEALNLSNAIDYKKGQATSLIDIANYYSYSGNPDVSIKYCNQALQIAGKHAYFEQIANANNTLGMTYFQKADYPSSYKHFLRAAEAAKKSANKERAIVINMNIGTMYSLLNDFDEALVYYDKALKISENATEEEVKWQIKSNVAYLQSNMALYSKAMKNINQSIAYFENTHLDQWLAFAYATKGGIYLKQKEYEAALVSFEKAKAVHDDLQDKKGMADVVYGLASSHLGTKELDIAEEFALQSLQMYQNMSIKTGQQRCYKILYEIMELKKNTSEALRYLKISEHLSDTIAAEVNKNNLKMLRTKLQFANEKKQLELDNQTELAEQKSITNWTLILLSGSLVFGYIIYNANKKKKQLNKALGEKTHELVKNEMRLMEINTNQKTLFSIVGHDLKGPISSLRELLKLMSDEQNKEALLHHLLPKLNKYTDHVYFTVDNLLSWGERQMKGADVNPDTIELRKIADRVLVLFSEAILKKDLTVNIIIEDGVEAWADKDDIEVVFRNLINNAIKFSHSNSEIKISATEKDSEMVIQFNDNGIGMTKEIQRTIFELNRYHSTPGTNNEKGTGLGLMLSKELLKRNKGKIEVKSAPRQGSTFSVYLPKVAV
jgi:signal transduction histidine kinase